MQISFKFLKKMPVDNRLKRIKKRIMAFKERRPHRSFRRTRRRDYVRSLKLPGYIKFNKYVFSMLWKNKKLFLLLGLTYALLTAAMVGVASQDTYSVLKDTLNTTGGDLLKGNWGEIGKASVLFLSTITGGLSDTLSESQQIYSTIIMLLAWLTSVWLLRNIMAGRKVKLRDGLYNAGAPILPTFMVAALLVIQLLPMALAAVGYGAASLTGILDGGIEAMLFWIADILLIVLSLYLISGTLFALVIVTLPGMYPSRAIKTAGDLVVGRRLRILGRILWMAFNVIITWALIIIPIILLDAWLKSKWESIEWLPTIPVIVLTLSALTIIWVSAYVYLLYRKVVDDGAKPA